MDSKLSVSSTKLDRVPGLVVLVNLSQTEQMFLRCCYSYLKRLGQSSRGLCCSLLICNLACATSPSTGESLNEIFDVLFCVFVGGVNAKSSAWAVCAGAVKMYVT